VLRSGCGPSESPLATLPAGTAVEIRSSLSGEHGTCYKVAASVEGKPVSGYLPAPVVSNASTFDQARRAARDMAGGSRPPSAPSSIIAKPSPALRDHPATKAIALLDSNQPAEALRLLEPHLQRYPSDPYLLAVAGMAFYRMDDLDRALMHWKEAESIRPDPGVASWIVKATREKQADAGSDRTAGTRVILRYERGAVPPDLAQAMVQVLDDEYSRIAVQLGCRASERITAVAQSPAAYRQSTQAAEWSGALYDGRIHVPVAPTRQVSAELRRTFAHELVHACLHELGNWPSWLHEGLAQKLSGETLPPSQKAEIQALLKAGKLSKLSRLGRNWSGLNSSQAAVAYLFAHYAVDRLFELKASTGIGNILRDPASFPQHERELEAALGL
jgi:hypothetical protein